MKWLGLVGVLAAVLLALMNGCSEFSDRKAQRRFIEAFEAAQTRQDVEAMLALYAWNGVDEDMRRILRFSIHTEISWPIVQARIVPLSEGDTYQYTHKEEEYVPNLQPIARLHVAYATPQAVNSSLLLGKNEMGDYRVILPQKVAN